MPPIPASQPTAPPERWFARHPVIFFFLLSYAFSWIWWGLWTYLRLPIPLFLVGTAGPTVAAFVVLAITSGKPAVLRLLRSYVHWRVGAQWYLVPLIGVPVLIFLSFLVVPGGLAGFVPPDWHFITSYLSYFGYCVFLAGGPLLEEGGWRGFALPRLQRLHGPLIGTLILGAFWALWHVPFYLGPLSMVGPDGTVITSGLAFLEYSIGVIGLSVIMAWVFNNTGGSVLMAILLHAAFDAAGPFEALFPSAKFDLSPSSVGTMGIAIAFGVAALIIIVATRGQLSYQRDVEWAG